MGRKTRGRHRRLRGNGCRTGIRGDAQNGTKQTKREGDGSSQGTARAVSRIRRDGERIINVVVIRVGRVGLQARERVRIGKARHRESGHRSGRILVCEMRQLTIRFRVMVRDTLLCGGGNKG